MASPSPKGAAREDSSSPAASLPSREVPSSLGWLRDLGPDVVGILVAADVVADPFEVEPHPPVVLAPAVAAHLGVRPGAALTRHPLAVCGVEEHHGIRLRPVRF